MNNDSKLIIFDLDGTLVDSQVFIIDAIKEAFDKEGLAIPKRKQILTSIGLSLSEAFTRLNNSLTATQKKRLIKSFKECYKSFPKEKVISPLYPSANDFLMNLTKYKNLSMAIATGKGKFGLFQILRAHNIESYFIDFQTSDNNPSKPNPTMILKILENLRIDSKNVLMVGDTDFDIIMAHQANIRSIAVLWGYQSKSQLVSARPTRLAESFLHLEAQIIELLFGGRI